MSAKILVVEDNEDSRFLVSKVLKRAGYEIMEAETGEEAIEKAVALRPDLILMDVGLAGMGGLEAASLLKKDKKTAAIPIVALTAYAMDGDRERTRAAGCDGYIAKPIDIHKFPEQVAKYLEDAKK